MPRAARPALPDRRFPWRSSGIPRRAADGERVHEVPRDAGLRRGTYASMSPEQARAREVDARADIRDAICDPAAGCVGFGTTDASGASRRYAAALS
jgi:hypothetical protein